MDDSVAFTNITQELVAETFALRSALHKTCNIHDLTSGGHNATRVNQFSQFIQSLIRNRDLSHLGVNGAKGEICCLRLGA